MVRSNKIFDLIKHSKWLCLLALAFCVCTDAPEYCGPGRQLNAHTEFCFDGEVYQKCGGNDYNPYTEFCYNRTRYQLCNGHEYNPARDFCDNNLMYPMCEGRDYNPQTHGCVNNVMKERCGRSFFDPDVDFCDNSMIYRLCEGQRFDPSAGCGGVVQGPTCDGEEYNVATHFCANNVIRANCGGSDFDPLTERCVDNSVTPITYTLMVEANPNAGGAVSPSGISTHNAGTQVTVTAAAVAGYRFTGWTGAATSVSPNVIITMTGNLTLTAVFQQIVNPSPGTTSYTLTTNTSPAAGGSITRHPNQTSYSSGATVSITANAASGYRFVNWTGEGVANAEVASTTVSMTANRTVTANFEWAGDGPGPTPGIHMLTLNRSPTSGGTVTRDPNQITYFSGTVVTITATANEATGFRFVNWSGVGVADPNSATTTVSVTADMTVTANFERDEIEVDIEMVFVQGGTFFMGCTPEQGAACMANESPAHQVTLSSFFIDKYPVTQAQWFAVMGDNPSSHTGDLSRPVERVSWNDIVNEFIPKLNEMTGMTYRLPTEAEWEFAARGGTNTRGYMYSGSDDINEVAWYTSNSSSRTTHPVGTKAPNELGIYDMSGNVWERVNDRNGSYTAEAKTNPTGPSSGSDRVIRGGNWSDGAGRCRVSFRGNDGAPAFRGSSTGFRLAVSP